MFHASRMRPPYGAQYGAQHGWQNGPREGWVRLSKQLKIYLNIPPGDETDGDLADKLNDPTESQRILKLINCRRLSGVGRVPIHTAFGWDGPANETSSLDDPGKTVEEYYRDAGHMLKAAQYKGESMKPMPGWGNSSKAAQNGTESKGIKDVLKDLADLQALEFQGIKNGIEDLKNMVETETELKAKIDRLEADNTTQSKQMQLKEAEAAHLRSIVDYYREAAPKVQLPAHFVIERILDGADKPTAVAGQKRKDESGSSGEHKPKNARAS